MIATAEGREADRVLIPVRSIGEDEVKSAVTPSGDLDHLFELTVQGLVRFTALN